MSDTAAILAIAHATYLHGARTARRRWFRWWARR